MNINIENYVSDEEIKEAVLSAVKEKVCSMSEKDIERVYTNACYKAVIKYSDEIIKEKGLEFSIEEQVKEIISGLSSYSVFYRGDGFNGSNRAYDLTQQIVEEEKHLLREVIKNKLNEAYSNHEASNDLARLMSDAVYDIFNIKKSS